MKNFKRLVALGLTAVMVFGSSLTVFAEVKKDSDGDIKDDVATADAQEITGTGSEAYVDKNVMKVTVPTTMTAKFDYKVDPDGLIAAAKSYGADAVSAVNDNDGVIFKNVDGTTVTASGWSDPVTITNKSAIPVKIGVTAKLTAASSQPIALTELSTTKDFSADGDKTKALFLGIQATNDVVRALGSSDVTADNILLSAADQYEIGINSGTYTYTAKEGAVFPQFSFYMTGAVNDNAAASTWYTENEGVRTANNPPTVSVKFTLTGVKDTKKLGLSWDNDWNLWLWKENAEEGKGGFSATTKPTVSINGGTAVDAGKVTVDDNGYVNIAFADIIARFGYAKTDDVPDDMWETLKSYVKGVTAVDNSITYYGEL